MRVAQFQAMVERVFTRDGLEPVLRKGVISPRIVDGDFDTPDTIADFFREAVRFAAMRRAGNDRLNTPAFAAWIRVTL